MRRKELWKYWSLTKEQTRAVEQIVRTLNISSPGVPQELIPNTLEWISSCSYYPRNLEISLFALDEICETFGVEYISSSHDGVYEKLGIEYLNTGGSYTPTLAYDYYTGKFSVLCLEDAVDRVEKRNKRRR